MFTVLFLMYKSGILYLNQTFERGKQMNKIKDFFKKSGKEGKVALTAVGVVGATTVGAHASSSDIVKNLLSYVFGIFFWIGVVLLAWGIGQLVLAFKNEDGDSKSRAIMLIVASIVLMGIGPIFNGLSIAGATGIATKSDF